MGMSVGKAGSDEPMMDVNTTPLIDVMLVLLILFIITIPPIKHATGLDLPQNPSAPTTPPVVIDIDIDSDGTYIWKMAGVTETLTLNQISERFQVESQKDPQPELHIKPDKWVKYDYVADLLAVAQRSHMDKLGVVGMENFLQQ